MAPGCAQGACSVLGDSRRTRARARAGARHRASTSPSIRGLGPEALVGALVVELLLHDAGRERGDGDEEQLLHEGHQPWLGDRWGWA
ncbi:hypothetical protein BCF74_1621 [Knoellia remsis]|uniref:Uncharacterized protein n=1 Tax=Knoellia remsis TaxID=407159 RepID=A0A2T0TPT2_9MICO|nr:hypothetical protein BCF74_1621 [Knoellia remsis]